MPHTDKIRVLIIEDQRRILEKQRRLLLPFDQIALVGAARDGRRGMALALKERPDVILLDLGLPDMDGVEVLQAIKAKLPDTEVLIFTVFDEEERVLEAVSRGASGYLLKGTPADRIVDAISDVHGGGSVIQPRLARRLLAHFQQQRSDQQQSKNSRLTPRETEILTLIAKGLTNRIAAETLGVSPATVRTHLEHIYAKLEVSNRTEAVTEAIRRGLIEP